MSNAPSAMTRRLAIAIASYIEHQGQWPAEARLSAFVLHSLASVLDPDHFGRLADRLKLRVTKHADITVGGQAGHMVYPPSEPPDPDLVAQVEHDLGFSDLIFDAPSQTLVELTDLLYRQEVFHQLALGALLGFSDLAQRLGLWTYGQSPWVTHEPRRGLFDLGLSQFSLHDDRPVEVYLELKVGSHLEPEQFERQQAGAGLARTAYILLGPTYYRWSHLSTPTFVGLPEVASAVRAVGDTHTGTIGELARVYGARLAQDAARWAEPLDPAKTWEALDYLRFYAQIASAWPEGVRIYPVTNRGGQQYILRAPEGTADLSGALWPGGNVYWEVVNAHLRFKLTAESPDGRRQLLDAWRAGLRTASAALGEPLTEPRVTAGRSLTAAELAVDLPRALLRDGTVDADGARDLYHRARALFGVALITLQAPKEAVSEA